MNIWIIWKGMPINGFSLATCVPEPTFPFNRAAHLGEVIDGIFVRWASHSVQVFGISLLTMTGLNLTGCVWTVDQETHNTVTVEFYDRELHRDFHFTDPYQYDRACLSKLKSLFMLIAILIICRRTRNIVFQRYE